MASWGAALSQRQVEPDPRPQKRQKASWHDGTQQRLNKHFEFATCVTCGMRPVEKHHVVPRSQGGDDVIENLAPICHQHHVVLESHAPGWQRVAAAVRVYVLSDCSRSAYVLEKIGRERFDSRYPLLSESVLPGEGASPKTRLTDSESDWDKYEEPVWRYRTPEDELENDRNERWRGPF